ncbi:MAG: hypothetical protein ACR2MN_07535 [Acidimicrobiales bacterium]
MTAKPRNIAPAEVDQIRGLAGEAWTTRQIAAQLGRSEAAVKATCKRHGIVVRADAPTKGGRRVGINRVIRQTGHSLDAQACSVTMFGWDGVDPEVAAEALHQLRSAMTVFRKLERGLAQAAQAVTVTSEPCEHCGRPVRSSSTGQVVRYCSRSCRQRAYEARKAAHASS